VTSSQSGNANQLPSVALEARMISTLAQMAAERFFTVPDAAVIAKMLRVMMLAPFLLFLAARRRRWFSGSTPRCPVAGAG
ncbi:putative sulfate exporter family transporter, partial [Klebsiella quasipneumoniae]